jgi:hypothetical protein
MVGVIGDILKCWGVPSLAIRMRAGRRPAGYCKCVVLDVDNGSAKSGRCALESLTRQCQMFNTLHWEWLT